jgi:hypothetical protein
MAWTDRLQANALPWLLKPDDPAVRYLALRDLQGAPVDDPEMIELHQRAHHSPPIVTILEAMDRDGYWVKPGAGYSPKYRSTVWSLIALAQMGASVERDARIQTACRYLVDHALGSHGQFSYNGTPSGSID